MASSASHACRPPGCAKAPHYGHDGGDESASDTDYEPAGDSGLKPAADSGHKPAADSGPEPAHVRMLDVVRFLERNISLNAHNQTRPKLQLSSRQMSVPTMSLPVTQMALLNARRSGRRQARYVGRCMKSPGDPGWPRYPDTTPQALTHSSLVITGGNTVIPRVGCTNTDDITSTHVREDRSMVDIRTLLETCKPQSARVDWLSRGNCVSFDTSGRVRHSLCTTRDNVNSSIANIRRLAAIRAKTVSYSSHQHEQRERLVHLNTLTRNMVSPKRRPHREAPVQGDLIRVEPIQREPSHIDIVAASNAAAQISLATQDVNSRIKTALSSGRLQCARSPAQGRARTQVPHGASPSVPRGASPSAVLHGASPMADAILPRLPQFRLQNYEPTGHVAASEKAPLTARCPPSMPAKLHDTAVCFGKKRVY